MPFKNSYEHNQKLKSKYTSNILRLGVKFKVLCDKTVFKFLGDFNNLHPIILKNKICSQIDFAGSKFDVLVIMLPSNILPLTRHKQLLKIKLKTVLPI